MWLIITVRIQVFTSIILTARQKTQWLLYWSPSCLQGQDVVVFIPASPLQSCIRFKSSRPRIVEMNRGTNSAAERRKWKISQTRNCDCIESHSIRVSSALYWNLERMDFTWNRLNVTVGSEMRAKYDQQRGNTERSVFLTLKLGIYFSEKKSLLGFWKFSINNFQKSENTVGTPLPRRAWETRQGTWAPARWGGKKSTEKGIWTRERSSQKVF